MKIIKEIEILAPIEKTYNAYVDISGWKNVLEDVLDVKVYYDDGHHQEFDMTVQRANKAETVHSVRFCYPHHAIEIFQTKPPPLLKRMSGFWKFMRSDRGTVIQSTRVFEVKPGADFNVAVLEKFLEHNLSAFKKWIEKHV